MKNFWHSNNPIVNDETTYGFSGIGLGGSDWLGVGKIFESTSKGTELCGARPLFEGKDRDEWTKCNQQAIALLYQQIKSKEEIEKRKKRTTIVIVSLVSIALITTVVLVLGKRKKIS
jgi:hypothetical protein